MYVEFFREKEHDIMPSASLVPQDDASLLWINSGMAPLKKYFDGRVAPSNPRMTNSQKCIRTNDIENVGKTARHQTFFEMLGNFSIGDYFKRETIHWAWEFLTERIGLDAHRLSVTIHPEDDEAFLIWHREIGVPEEKILRLEENFWDIGEGPCGPNSEVFFDRGKEVGCGREECDAACDCDRHLEIWNLVFSQYNHNPDGSYTPLPKKNIDTGMGLERTASVLQNVATNFDTDLFRPIIDEAARLVGVQYGVTQDIDTKLKIIADHVRTVSFSITDGVSPSNEGRGYVIRRLLRRAVRSGKQLGYNHPFLHRLVATVGTIMEDYYPEVLQKKEYVERIIRLEEDRFFETLTEGESLLDQVISQVKKQGKNIIPGAQAFKLYDTYGFPVDLTEEIAAENGLSVDREAFSKALEEQRARARNARQEIDSMQVQTTVLRDLDEKSSFVGYTEYSIPAKIEWMLVSGEVAAVAELGERVQIVLDRTPFYAESGGQAADRGMLIHPSFELRVLDVQKAPHGQHVHDCEVVMGRATIETVVTAAIDVNARLDIMKHHTATHLLHKALREVLGEHVAQAGSLVQSDRLRFDFSHVGALSSDELEQVERLVNEEIWRDEVVTIEEMPQKQAKLLGAMALFGEKYGDIVRVVRAGTYSLELCGGCHVERTGQIGLFKLVQESGIGSGVRRVEAVTGKHAYEHVLAEEKLLFTMAESMRANVAQLPERIDAMLGHTKQLQREIEGLTAKLGRVEAMQLLNQIEPIFGGHMLVAKLQDLDVEGLRAIVDELKSRRNDLLILLGSTKENKVAFVVYVPIEYQTKGYHAGKLVKEVAAVAGGTGGGRADIAQAGGKQPEQLDAALRKAKHLLTVQLTQ